MNGLRPILTFNSNDSCGSWNMKCCKQDGTVKRQQDILAVASRENAQFAQ